MNPFQVLVNRLETREFTGIAFENLMNENFGVLLADSTVHHIVETQNPSQALRLDFTSDAKHLNQRESGRNKITFFFFVQVKLYRNDQRVDTPDNSEIGRKILFPKTIPAS
jgi:hypothetical protein